MKRNPSSEMRWFYIIDEETEGSNPEGIVRAHNHAILACSNRRSRVLSLSVFIWMRDRELTYSAAGYGPELRVFSKYDESFRVFSRSRVFLDPVLRHSLMPF